MDALLCPFHPRLLCFLALGTIASVASAAAANIFDQFISLNTVLIFHGVQVMKVPNRITQTLFLQSYFCPEILWIRFMLCTTKFIYYYIISQRSRVESLPIHLFLNKWILTMDFSLFSQRISHNSTTFFHSIRSEKSCFRAYSLGNGILTLIIHDPNTGSQQQHAWELKPTPEIVGMPTTTCQSAIPTCRSRWEKPAH